MKNLCKVVQKKDSNDIGVNVGIDTLRVLYLNHFKYAPKRVAGRARKKGNEMGVNNSALEDSCLVVHIFHNQHH